MEINLPMQIIITVLMLIIMNMLLLLPQQQLLGYHYIFEGNVSLPSVRFEMVLDRFWICSGGG